MRTVKCDHCGNDYHPLCGQPGLCGFCHAMRIRFGTAEPEGEIKVPPTLETLGKNVEKAFNGLQEQVNDLVDILLATEDDAITAYIREYMSETGHMAEDLCLMVQRDTEGSKITQKIWLEAKEDGKRVQ